MSLKSVIGKEFEVYDVNEFVTPQNIRHKVAENVEFVLKRVKLLPKGYSVVIPVGGDDYSMGEVDNLSYVGNFEVFAPDLDTIVAYGRTRGYGLGNELHEVDVTITEATGNKPKRKAYSVSPKRSGRKSSGGNAGLGTMR